MDFKDALRSIRKHWIVVMVATLFGVGGAAYFIVRATPAYQSTVTFFVSTPASDDAAALAADQFANRRVNTYIHLASSDRLAKLVAHSAPGLATRTLANEISASSALNTVLLTISVVDPVRARSLAIAKSVATQFPVMVHQIEPVSATSGKVTLRVTSDPRLNPDPVRPSRALTAGLGLFAGLLVGIAFAVLRDLFDTSVRSTEVLRAISNHPVLGSIGFDTSADDEPLLIGRQIRSTRAESFRQLRTNLQFMNVDNPARVIVVTSSVANEGKSTTCANLAMVFAESGRSTLLIEADMRRPRVTDYLGLERSVGLSNVLASQVAVDEVLQKWGDGGLTVLSGGTVPPNPSEMLGSHGMTELIESMRARFDVIIIDTPPLLPVTDAAVTSVHADGVLVVVRYGSTTRNQLASAMRSLEAVDARIFGSVLNMTKIRRSSRDGYDSYGYYDEASGAPDAIDEVVHVVPSFDDQDAAVADLSRASRSAVTGTDERPADSIKPGSRWHGGRGGQRGTAVAGGRRIRPGSG